MIAYKYTVTGGATSVSGADDNGLTLTYTVGKEQVYINGVLQVRDSDYTASTGSSITGISAMLASDIVTVLAFTSFVVADTYTQAQADARFVQQSTNFFAGKNKIINGDFSVNQRSFTSVTTDSTFIFDRWRTTINNATGSTTFTPQVFTPGTAPVSGYEGVNFVRIVTAGQSTGDIESRLNQRLEDVRTFAGQTVTLSFWAKAASGTPNVSIEFLQFFGTGGSPSAVVTGSVATNTVKKFTLSTSWVRYSHTFTIPSISGKTLGTNNDSYLGLVFYVSGGNATRTDSLGVQNNTFDIWGVQAEAGSIATPFQTATGTIQGELAACQRYYWQQGGAFYQALGPTGYTTSTTNANAYFTLPVEMRTVPTLTYAQVNWRSANGNVQTPSAIIITGSGLSTTKVIRLEHTLTAATSGLWGYQEINATNAGYLGLSAEL
jgi:hypothetical protein